jgi:ACR3 family arsenite transporter
LWGLCLATSPRPVRALAGLEYASVNLVVAVLIWAMVYPMMIAIDFGSLKDVGRRPKGLVITLVINWLIKPFTMAALAVLFFNHLFAGLIDPAKAPEYIAGLILLGAAPCTAMVFVWSQLTKGDPNYTLVQVSVNDLIMVVAFAPIVAFLLGVTDITVPWETLILSVVLYIVIPLIAGALTRRALIARGRSGGFGAFTARIKPASVLGLLLTVVLLFGFQGQVIIAQPLLIALIAVPIIIQSYGIFALGYAWAFAWKLPHKVARPAR